MKDYGKLIVPFQTILSYFILRAFYHKTDYLTYGLILLCLIIDMTAIFIPDLFPVSSFLVIIALLMFYKRGWGSALMTLIVNVAMFVAYFKVPMGNYFVAAVNYYIAYTLIHTMTENEFFIKNMLFYATLKHLSIAGAYHIAPEKNLDIIPDIFSLIIVYYMVRASYYYYRKFKEESLDA